MRRVSHQVALDEDRGDVVGAFGVESGAPEQLRGEGAQRRRADTERSSLEVSFPGER